MSKFKISVDEDTCIGCGACVATCPEFFEMRETDSGEKAKAKTADSDELACAKDAAEVCPVNSIHISEDGQKLI